MDELQKHIIRRLVIEMKGVRESDARQLQDELSRMFKENIDPLLDKYLTAANPVDKLQRIEKLELNLGTISRNNLSGGIIKKIIKQLEAHFQPVTQNKDKKKPAPEKEIPQSDRHLHLFRFFVETGNLPWWSDNTIADPVNESFEILARTEPSLLIELTHTWINQPDFLLRIVRQLSFPNWILLAALKLNVSHSELIDDLSQLSQSLKKIGPWTSMTKNKLQEMLGVKFLSWTYFTNGPVNETQKFWKEFLTQMAVSNQINFGDFVNRLVEVITDIGIDESNNEKSFAKKMMEMQQQYLQEQLLAESANSTESIKSTQSAKLKSKSKSKSKSEKEKKRKEKDNENVEVKKYENKISEKEDNGDALQKQQINHVDEPYQPSQRVDLNEQNQAVKRRNRKTEELRKAEKDSFDSSDELFVGNAGLVILWPFLTRFFENIGLLADRRFTDIAASHRAVGLLQFLADGQPEPLEHQCGLNKILCGLAWDDVLDFGEPVTDAEQEAAEIMLQAVIANAPVLANMSVSGFRGSFLLRNGILRSGAGLWHLQVEKKAYDVVLEKFPWSWSIIKLPWMQWGMDVEW